MDESAKLWEWLQALHGEAAAEAEPGGSPAPPFQLFNPLAHPPPSSGESPSPPPRFDYYTDPVFSFSGSKRCCASGDGGGGGSFRPLWRADDVTQVLCELELIIRKVKVSTTPDGRVMDLFFLTDARELLHSRIRRDETCRQLRAVLGDSMTSCDIEPANEEVAACLQASSSRPPWISDEMFNLELPEEQPKGSVPTSYNVSVTMDNTLSPRHTLIQILCCDHKGLLYDIMGMLKDYNIKISYGRFCASENGKCEIDLFVMQMDGKKIVDRSKQKALCARVRMELFRPLRVVVMNRGPDTELLVANPVELSGKGRPLVFYDITLALKLLHIRIFLAEIGRHVVGDREWEVYRILLGDDYEISVSRNKIVEGVTKMLMGWE